MPLQKLQFKPGINKEVTNYTNEGGWYDCDKIRFRSNMPEKIGGWTQLSPVQYLGVCRSLWNWIDLEGTNYIGVGTNLKYFIEKGGGYNDVTPIRKVVNPMLGPVPPSTGNPFTASNGSATITVIDVGHGANNNDFVTFSGATSLGGNITAAILNQEYQISYVDANTYTFQARAVSTVELPGAAVLANASDTAHGGNAITATYQIQTGNSVYTAGNGWGAGYWGRGAWGSGTTVTVGDQLRLWTNDNFGENLLIAPRGGAIYYWLDADGPTVRAKSLSSLSTFYGFAGTFVPTATYQIVASAIQRFVIAFGANNYDPTDANTPFDRMLVRWSDQENPYDWVPTATNQSGEYRLGNGSYILAARNTRQEILVWTDSSLYSMQYLGPPYVWGFNIIQDNITMIGPNVPITINNITYWMGTDKFYAYDGRVQTLPCTLRKYIFSRINRDQSWQCFAGANEAFSEIWWFYPSTGSSTVDSYVIYNYLEGSWYHGSMARTAWLESGLREYPVAADYNQRLLYHESSVDDEALAIPLPIVSYIQSSDFDIGDGHNFGFVWRILPDLTFANSTATNPAVTMRVQARVNSGTEYGTPDNRPVTRSAEYPVELYTGQVYTRIRGRQMDFRIDSADLGVNWQLGSPRIDIRPDGRR
jgi:hypothetical protein